MTLRGGQVSNVDRDVVNKAVEIFKHDTENKVDPLISLGNLLQHAKLAYTANAYFQLAENIAVENDWPPEYEEAIGHFQGVLYSMAYEFYKELEN